MIKVERQRVKPRLETYIGKKYNHLTITGIDRKRMQNSKYSDSYVFADCDCGICGKSYNLAKLKKGETKSCGHLIYEKRQRKFNKIIHKDGYGIIYTNDKEFLFDIEDEEKLLNKWWYEDCYGYLKHVDVINGKNKYTLFHRIVVGAKSGEYVDHISNDKKDNRKCNLRKCTHQQNDMNKKITNRNTTGVIGVFWDKSRNKWASSITYKRKKIYLGRYNNKDDAIVARLKAEKVYFGEFAPQKHLYKKYLKENKND